MDTNATWSGVLAEIGLALDAKCRRIAELERELKEAREPSMGEIVMTERCAGLERELAARPVVETQAAARLREALNAHPYEWERIMAWRNGAHLVACIKDLASSTPPASIPVREVVVESEAARELREAWSGLKAHDRDLLTNEYYSSTPERNDFRAALRAFFASAPPTSAPSEDVRVSGSERTRLCGRITELELALGAERQAHAETRLGYERSESDLEREVEALRATPPRVEREVDRDLRAALPSHLEWTDPDLYVAGSDRRKAAEAISAWLAEPLSAAPAQDEYTKAAVAFAEEFLKGNAGTLTEWNAALDAWRDIYDARRRGEASAAKVDPAPAEERRYVVVAPNGSVLSGLYNEQERTHELEKGYRWFRAVEDHGQPKPADERVTMYVPVFEDNRTAWFYPESEYRRSAESLKSAGVMYWLALPATVVREGGAS